ncbi:MAG: leucine-rich repeat protein [Verrucomicrobiales bacterium]
MKMISVLLLLCLSAICNAEIRTWTSIVGTKVKAELVSLTGNKVTLKTKAGKTLKLPLNKLSKADQEFLKAKSSPREPTKEETPVNPNLKYKIKEGTVTITACDEKASGALIIPATIEGKTVTNIEKWAFLECTNLTSITIPDTVTSIDQSAFADCNSLTSITIGDGVTSIGSLVFNYCTSLASVTIPDSVTSIGSSVFANCTSLTSVTFLGDAPSKAKDIFYVDTSSPTIYRKPEAKGWGDTWGGRPVKLISEKP